MSLIVQLGYSRGCFVYKWFFSTKINLVLTESLSHIVLLWKLFVFHIYAETK